MTDKEEEEEENQSEEERFRSISVVISCLNESENISKCVRSTLARGCKNWGIQHTDGEGRGERVRTKVVVVDGGSTDDTVLRAKKVVSDIEKKRDFCKDEEEEVIIVERAERGRAKQFNRGGRVLLRDALEETTKKKMKMKKMMKEPKQKRFDEKEKDNIFVFLHADTTMPDTYREDIYDALRRERERRERERRFPSAWGVIKNGCAKFARLGRSIGKAESTNENNRADAPCWGAFPIKISGERSKWKKCVVASFANFRTRRTSIPYGDQAIFVTASAFAEHKFDESKMFMEDYEYSLRMKKCFGKPAICKSPVVTDSRRFESVGFMSTTMINILCVVGFHLKVDVGVLAKFYRNANKRRGVDTN
jgi:glycosyltransferase involved in cell wall biosynthesis